MYADLLSKRLDSFIGLQVWTPVAGRGAGTTVSMNFGPARLRKVPLKNSMIDAKNREYEADRSLFIEDGRWSLWHDSILVCSSEAEDYGFARYLSQISGKTVTYVALDARHFKCTLRFEEGYRLEIEANSEEDCYTFFIAQDVFIVSGGGIRFEKD